MQSGYSIAAHPTTFRAAEHVDHSHEKGPVTKSDDHIGSIKDGVGRRRIVVPSTPQPWKGL